MFIKGLKRTTEKTSRTVKVLVKEAVLDSAIVDIVLGPEYALGEIPPSNSD